MNNKVNYWLAITRKENIEKVMDKKKFALREKKSYANIIKKGDKLILYGSPKKIYGAYEIDSNPFNDESNMFWEGKKKLINLKVIMELKQPILFDNLISNLKFLAKVKNKKSHWVAAIMGRHIRPIPKEDFDFIFKKILSPERSLENERRKSE